MRLKLIAVAGAAFFVVAGAQAQDRDPCGANLVCASSADSVMAAMEKAGFKPKKSADNEGDTMIESDEAAYHFDVYFYGCEKHLNCDSLRFETIFRKEPENTPLLANKWNADHRFLQAAIKRDGNFTVSYDLATIGGLTQRNFADVLDWWKSQLEDLADFFQKEVRPSSANDPKAK